MRLPPDDHSEATYSSVRLYFEVERHTQNPVVLTFSTILDSDQNFVFSFQNLVILGRQGSHDDRRRMFFKFCDCDL